MTVMHPSLPASDKRGPAPAGNMATGTLKLIALLFMFIDHTGKVFFNNCGEMRILGRIAFPIYIWCMIVGFYRTRSVPKYIFRVLQVGIVSQPLYYLALDRQLSIRVLLQNAFAPLSAGFSPAALWDVFYTIMLKKPNIFLSLALGLVALWGIRERKWLSQIWAPALAICLATILHADYGWKGIMLFILLYTVQDSRPAIAAVMAAFCLFWGANYSVTTSLFGVRLSLDKLPDFLSEPLKAVMRLETYAVFATPFMIASFRRDIRLPKWLSYSLYPAHLAVMILMKLFLPA